MLCDIGINLLSDIIFIILGLLILWLYYWFSQRARLLKFFGIKKNKSITIYISNLKVLRGGSTGIDGTSYSFQGSAISSEESKAATQLQSLFNYFLPSQVDKPDILNKILIADIDVKVIPSPSNEIAIEQSATIIALGSPVYNVVSGKIQQDGRVFGKFETTSGPTVLDFQGGNIFVGEGQQVLPSGWKLPGTANPIDNRSSIPSATSTISSDQLSELSVDPGLLHSSKDKAQQIVIPNVSPYQDPTFGFVQRFYDNENQRNIFYAAGLSDFSTAGCAYYLISNWRKLFEKYSEQTPFLILLKFDVNDKKLWQIVLEKSIP